MSDLHWVFAAFLTLFATVRIIVLIVDDTFPPSVWFRMWWDRHTNDSWGELVHCPYCVGVYVAFGVVLAGWLSDWHTAWWIMTGGLSTAYLGSTIVDYWTED